MSASPYIPYARQSIVEEDLDAVVDQLQSLWVTQGPKIEEFESSVSEYVGSAHAIAVSSCTAALHLACLALEIGKGDLLWTVPNTFVASSNCGLYCGAEVDFVDIDARTLCMDVDALALKLEQAQELAKLPSVLVAVHFSGSSCDMERIFQLSKKYGFKVIEDAAHAIGGTYNELKVGSCKYSDITVFSFHPVKILTTGEGGMLVTNDENLAKRVRKLRTHGIVRDDACLEVGAWYYEMEEMGYHYRMTDIQAALGCSQMKRLDAFVARRKELVQYYNEQLSGLPLILPTEAEGISSSWHLYVIQVQSDRISRKEVFDFMREKNVIVNVHYIPVYWQPFYEKLGFHRGYCPVSENYYENAISIPLFYDLKKKEQDRVIELLKSIL